MHLSKHRFLAYTILLPLAVFVLYRGIVPALTQLDTDFPNYYTAAKIVVDGKDASRLYDDLWFQEQIRAYGMQLQGKFSPFPPATALLYIPLTVFDPLQALRITTIINLGLLLLSTMLLSRLLSLSLVESAIFTLLSGIGLVNCLRFGQLYIALSCSIILGYYAYKENRPTLAGIWFGLFIPLKYFPIIFVAFFIFKKEWRIVLSSAMTVIAITIVSIVVLGWEVHREFLFSVVGNHLGSQLSQQDPFSSTFQSWDSLLRRLLMFDPVSNPRPLFMANDFFPWAKACVLIVLAATGVLSIWRVSPNRMVGSAEVPIGVLGLLGLLIAPATATYHFVLLWLPVALLVSTFLRQGRRFVAYAMCGLYAAIGFIPYSFVRTFEERNALTLFAYPRLFILLGMFLIVQYVIWNRTTPLNVSMNSTMPSSPVKT